MQKNIKILKIQRQHQFLLRCDLLNHGLNIKQLKEQNFNLNNY